MWRVFSRRFSSINRKFIFAIDQGTTSSRVIAFDSNCKIVDYEQCEHKQITPNPGWVEHDPIQIINNIHKCAHSLYHRLTQQIQLQPSEIKCLSITNQRETTVCWDKNTGKPLCNALVWLDTRTTQIVQQIIHSYNGNKDVFRPLCGLPVNPYFSALKMKWMIQNYPQVAQKIKTGEAIFGTIDSWIIWNLTKGQSHYTDITNASRTMLMDLKSLEWDQKMTDFFGINPQTLPQIKSCSEMFGICEEGIFKGIPITGVIGDQQSACLGHLLEQGEAKCTYGTGCFILMNTGKQIIQSKHGMLTTPCYKLGPDQPTQYALEGAIEMGGASISWAKNNLGLFQNFDEMNKLLLSVPDNGDVYFIPAFSGLFAPHWKEDARGLIMGLSQHTNKAHIVRAIIDAICLRTKEGLEAMEKDSGIKLSKLTVDGGVTVNDIIMQNQSNLINTPVERKVEKEITALGSAIAAGLCKDIKVWENQKELKDKVKVEKMYHPAISQQEIDQKVKRWNLALKRSLDWINY